MHLKINIPQLLPAFLATLLSLSFNVNAGDSIGEVIFVKGVTTAQHGNSAPRVIGKGDVLNQGDKLDTGKKSFTVIKLKDGSRITLRPETAMVLDHIEVRENQESGLITLLKGGLRTITGFISKRRPGNLQVKTPSSTIGIRGTDFDARLCEQDCAEENQSNNLSSTSATVPVIARAKLISGVVTVKRTGKADRLLSKGGPVYEGETIDTGMSAFVVLAFVDKTVLTVQANTSFQVDGYHHQTPNVLKKRESNVAFRLFKGGLRMLTGLIGKKNPENVRIITPMASLGIRGTGIDVSCGAGCVDPAGGDTNLEGIQPGLHASVWSGEAFIQLPSGIYSVRNGEAYFMAKGATTPVKIPVIPIFIRDNPAPRPDKVEIDFNQLFDVKTTAAGSPPGLYVTVRDGHITLEHDGRVLDVAGGESGFAGAGALHRLPVTPGFIQNDPYPAPEQFDENVQRIIELISDEADGIECTL